MNVRAKRRALIVAAVLFAILHDLLLAYLR